MKSDRELQERSRQFNITRNNEQEKMIKKYRIYIASIIQREYRISREREKKNDRTTPGKTRKVNEEKSLASLLSGYIEKSKVKCYHLMFINNSKNL